MTTKRAKAGEGKRAGYHHKWYIANKNEIRVRQRRYYQEHWEEVLARKHRYYQEHREEIAARVRIGFKPWRKGGPGRPPLSAKKDSTQ